MPISKESKEVLNKSLPDIDRQIAEIDERLAPLLGKRDELVAQIQKLNQQRSDLVARKKKIKADAEA